MKKLIAALAATLALSTPAPAADFEAEVMEWAIEPCMTVRAALQAKDLDENSRAMGVKLHHVVQIMMAEKQQAARDLVKGIAHGTPWEKRAGLYVATLLICLQHTEGLRLE